MLVLNNEVALALFVGLALRSVPVVRPDEAPVRAMVALRHRNHILDGGAERGGVHYTRDGHLGVEPVLGVAVIGGLLKTKFTDGTTSQTMQQGGLRLFLTMLIITAPPTAASFLQSTLGYFTPRSVFGNGGTTRDVAGRYPGQPGWMPSSPTQTADTGPVQQPPTPNVAVNVGDTVKPSTG